MTPVVHIVLIIFRADIVALLAGYLLLFMCKTDMEKHQIRGRYELNATNEQPFGVFGESAA